MALCLLCRVALLVLAACCAADGLITNYTGPIKDYITKGDAELMFEGCLENGSVPLAEGKHLMSCLDEARLAKLRFFYLDSTGCWASKGATKDTNTPRCGHRIFRWKRAEPYNKESPPNTDSGPVNVYMSATVIKLNSIDTKRQRYSYSMYFRQEWVDERLHWEPKDFGNQMHVNLTRASTTSVTPFMWTSDAFFSTAIEIVNPDSDESFTVRYDGYILWSRLLQITSFCDMNMLYYPFDYQECITDIESYAYDISFLNFSDFSTAPSTVHNDDIKLDDNPTACSVCNVNTLNSYKLESLTASYHTKLYRSVTFSAVRWVFPFGREPATYFINTFLPLWLICLLSLGSCYIDVASSPARVGMGITTVLVLISQMNGLKADLPVVSYITAMDVYLIMCLVYVVANVAEYGVINYVMVKLQTRDKLRKLKREYIEKEEKSEPVDNEKYFSFSRSGRSIDNDNKSVSSYKDYSLESTCPVYEEQPTPLTEAEDAYLKECFETFNTKHEKITSSTLQPVLFYMGVPSENIKLFMKYTLLKEKNNEDLSYMKFAEIIQRMGILQRYGVRATTILGRGVTMSSLRWFEARYRIVTPFIFVGMNVVWFAVVLTLSHDGKNDQ